MNIIQIIEKKKNKIPLTGEEINFWIDGVSNDTIARYQTSALLMAIYLNGFSDEETVNLTYALANSGISIDYNQNGNFYDSTVDKHSTGGVGDSVSLILAPILASCGLIVGKMSGKGLGFTGGTIDKLESISGFKTQITFKNFIEQLKKIGVALISQTDKICPADKILYALRDVTSTVESLPLITASVMAKKLACGAKNIIIDIKCGQGALLQTIEECREMKRLMTYLGEKSGRNIKTVISNMDIPLGEYIGNALEVIGAVEVLKGKKNSLYDLSIYLSSVIMDSMGMDGKVMAVNAIESGRALEKFREMVVMQHGNDSFINNPQILHTSKYKYTVTSVSDGYINSINAKTLAQCVRDLGGGRLEVEDKIYYGVGIKLLKNINSYVECGDALAEVYCKNKEGFKLEDIVRNAYSIGVNQVKYDLILE